MRSDVPLTILDVRARPQIRAGFGEVFVLEGGMQGWVELGHPVEERRDSAPSSRP
jgi:hypothetical protein